MSNTLQVNPKTLKTKATDMRNKNKRLLVEIANLQAKEAILNVMWDGDANTEFHNQFNKDIKQMKNFYDAIEKYAKALDEIADNYTKAEKQNLSTAQTRTYK